MGYRGRLRVKNSDEPIGTRLDREADRRAAKIRELAQDIRLDQDADFQQWLKDTAHLYEPAHEPRYQSVAIQVVEAIATGAFVVGLAAAYAGVKTVLWAIDVVDIVVTRYEQKKAVEDIRRAIDGKLDQAVASGSISAEIADFAKNDPFIASIMSNLVNGGVS